jgi:hypothetical protein
MRLRLLEDNPLLLSFEVGSMQSKHTIFDTRRVSLEDRERAFDPDAEKVNCLPSNKTPLALPLLAKERRKHSAKQG